MVKRILRIVVITIISLVALIGLFLLVSIKPLSRTQAQDTPEYAAMMQRLDSLQPTSGKGSHDFVVGFAKENMTPSHPISLAGYGNRLGKPYTSVRDSIYVRAMVVDNGIHRVAIVSADLLIIPPTVTLQLEKKLPAIGFSINNTFLGAIHTHNSIGNWGEGAIGIMYGDYEDSIVNFIANKIIRCIAKASANGIPASIHSGSVSVPAAVRNRLIDTGSVDSLLRVVEVKRQDSSRLILMSYTAHATCLFSRDLKLSRDYPGELVDGMEANGYTFAMFMAGAVGSHRCNPPEYGESCIDWMADTVRGTYLAKHPVLTPVTDSSLSMMRIPLALPPSEAKITKDWQLRPWLFKAAFGQYQTYLTALRIGHLVMIGTPCDYSGQLTAPLDSLAAKEGAQVMVTSFNGGYIGYITADQYYDRDHYETRLMNWYGPGNGDYLTTCLLKLIHKIDEEQPSVTR
ncbi:MAG TPA: neutral/alkaline non-lysosomal ceramidase N-terminal domain-containing protein [Ohtaekwangia sp.]|uniref:neutral/alkaline non-lysosomal ceramidase N-terminal domain-containing protein n=1 Tax=Ohtaekwangia sp. TaxID=2066019 RepID=UPI002F94C21D